MYNHNIRDGDAGDDDDDDDGDDEDCDDDCDDGGGGCGCVRVGVSVYVICTPKQAWRRRAVGVCGGSICVVYSRCSRDVGVCRYNMGVMQAWCSCGVGVVYACYMCDEGEAQMVKLVVYGIIYV